MDLDILARQALANLPNQTRDLLAADPPGALAQLGLQVVAVDEVKPQRGDAGACDGTSFLDDGVILYARTPNSRRENFTLAHELGHFLIDQTDVVIDALADEDHAPELLETLCDRIAHRLLMPAAAVEQALSGGTVCADAVVRLHEHTQASWPVCAIALAERLPCVGAVIVVQDSAVIFASVHPDPVQGWPTVVPWRGHPIPAGHPLKSLAPNARFTRLSFWENLWGSRERFYIDAAYEGRRVIAVLSERDLWGCERLHLDPGVAFDSRPAWTITCCGVTREVRGYPCPTCGHGYCPTCKQCRCEKAAAQEVACTGCFLTFAPHLLVDGLCEDCR